MKDYKVLEFPNRPGGFFAMQNTCHKEFVGVVAYRYPKIEEHMRAMSYNGYELKSTFVIHDSLFAIFENEIEENN